MNNFTQRENILRDRSKDLALRIISLSNYLRESLYQFSFAQQLFKSGTSIGANIRESEYAQSPADFISKLQISLKEANETLYWLELMYEMGYLSRGEFDSIGAETQEIIKMLISSINTKKKRMADGKY